MVVILLLLTSGLFAQGDTSPIINVCGKNYEITGDFMTVVIARNIVFGEPETLAPKVVQQIKNRYEEKVDSLLARRDLLELSDQMVQDSLSRLEVELNVAEYQAMELAREFTSIDLKTTSYLYQLAYYFYGNGQLVEALEVMSDDALAKIELNQAKKYVLKAMALKRTGDIEGSTKTLKTASDRYPCYGSIAAYGRQLTETKALGCGIVQLKQAIGLAGSPGERSQGYLWLANAFLCEEEVGQAHRVAEKVLLIHEQYRLNISTEIAEARSILNLPVLTTRQKAEQYLFDNDLVRFDQIMKKEEVSNYELPFSTEAYQLKLLYLERLRLTDPAAAKKAQKLIRKYWKTNKQQ
ncbi:MAG: hypothetical protein AB8H12_14785 [Lewinella sp.]